MMKAFSNWLTTAELGCYLLEREQAFYRRAVSDVFGFHAVQVGVPDVNFLDHNRIPWQCRVAETGPVDIRCEPERLPFETRSLDLLLMPHVLDFTTKPHHVLREAERVLMPEGRLVLTGFNPLSLWGLRRLIQGRSATPWCGNFLSLARIKDWLALLELEANPTAFMGYAPPFSRHDWLARCHYLEQAGNRWWPLTAAVYGIEAIKRQRGMRLITPTWKPAKAAPGLAVAGSNDRQPSHKKPADETA